MNLFQILTSITYLKFCTSLYEHKCPTALSWRIRGKTLCKSSTKYSCLHDENRDTSREICREMPSLLVPGNKYVIRGNLDGEECKGYRYQPFIFKTNQSSDCAFLKSRCSEIGQLTYSNGSTTDDRSCRCDYSKSYAPIHKPSNSCYCMPSVEDCSCHLKLCPDRTHLSSEYVCVSDYTLIKPDVCGPIQLSKSNTIMTIEGNIETQNFNEDRANTFLLAARFTAIAVVFILLLLTVLLICAGMELFSDVQSLSSSISKKNLFDDSNISKELDGDVIQTPPTPDQIKKTVTSVDGINKFEDETKTPPTLHHIKKTTSSFDGIKKFEDETKTPPTVDHIKKTTSSFDGIKKFEDGTQTPPNQIKKTGSSFDGIKKYEDDTLSSPTPDQKTEVASNTDGIRSKSDDSKNEKKPDNLKMAEDISSSNTAQFPLDPKKADILKTNHDFLVDEVRIVVVGKTGVGKSATANSIIGETHFTSRPGASSVTVNCEKKVVNIHGKKIAVVDTPGIFDTRVNSETLELEIRKCIAMTLPGPHAVLFVLNLNDRYTDNDYKVYKYFLEHFGDKILNYGIVVFTNADAIQRANQRLDNFLENSPETLKDVLKFFGNRKIAFNNIDKTQFSNQRQYLLKMIDALKQGNHNDPYYEDKNFRKIDELLRQVYHGEEKHKKTEEELDEAKLEIEKLKEDCRIRDEALNLLMELKLEWPRINAAKDLPQPENYCEKEDKSADT